MPWVQYGEGTDASWVSDEEAQRLAPDPERDVPPVVKQDYNNDERAVTKVFDALRRAGLSGPQIVTVFNEIEHAGVIFRERN